MAFLDWFGYFGTGVQSIFAWGAYNRDAFADNVAMRQNQKYQQKNYHISWIAVARDDIRDMMGISVNRINNYMIVATLILSVAAGAVVSVSLDRTCPDFVVFSFYLSIATSIVFLMLSIMFGVKGQNSAFTNTMRLLTYQVRPENPAEYSHDYMKQVQWIERNGIANMFRIPGLMPAYNTQPTAPAKTPDSATGGEAAASAAAGRAFAGGPAGNGGVGQALHGDLEENLEDATPLESLVTRSSHTWYLTKFQQFMRLWHPYDTHSKYCMGLGVIGLGHGSTYFALGQLISEGRVLDEWAACVLSGAFLIVVWIIVEENFKAARSAKYSVMTLLISGPLLGVIGAIRPEGGAVRGACAPLSFVCHAAFYFVAAVATHIELQGGHGDRAVDAFDWGRPAVPGRHLHHHAPEAQRRPAPGKSGKPGGGADLDGKGVVASVAAKDLNIWENAGPNDPATTDERKAHWPTDNEEFQEKAEATSVHIRTTVRSSLFVVSLLWFAMFLWAAAKFWLVREQGGRRLDAASSAAPGPPELGPAPAGTLELAGEVPVAWPSPLFRPTAVTCAGDSVFVADSFRVFQVPLVGGTARLVPCNLSRPVAAATSACDAGACRPLLLLEGLNAAGAPEVADCSPLGTRVEPLLGAGAPEHLQVLPGGAGGPGARRLLTARGRRLELLAPRGAAGGWAPEWALGALGAGPPLRGLAAAGEQLLLLLGGAEPGEGLVLEVRSSATMRRAGRWRAPPLREPLAAGGCAAGGQAGSAAAEGLSVVVLSSGQSLDGPPPRLLRLEPRG